MASFDAHTDFAYSTVLTAPSPASSGTSLVVQSGDGAKFPAASFNAVVWPAGAQPLTTNAEIVRVTVIATDTFTITRTQESTSARSIVVGDQIAGAISAKTLTDIENILSGTTTQAQLDDALVKGNLFNSQNATDQNTTLTASTNFTYDNLLEIGASNTLEIPSTSTLEIEPYVDQAFFRNTLGVAPLAGNTFNSQSNTQQNITLPISSDFLVEDLFEIGVGVNFEIPATSTLEIAGYARQSGGTVGTPALAQASVTPPKLATGSTSMATNSASTTTSTSYTATLADNITTGVTVTIGANGLALVSISGILSTSSASVIALLGWSLSGANTLAASDFLTIQSILGQGNNVMACSYVYLHTGLTAGVTTFNLAYRVNGAATGTFNGRNISVVPL